MKIFKNNCISNCTLLSLLTYCTLITTSSCNKNNNQTEQEIPNGQSQITVRIASINEGDLSIINGTKATSSKPTIRQKQTINIVEGNGFDAVIAIDNNSPTTTQTAVKAANNTRAAASPMEAGTLYRLFLYKKNNNTYNYSKSVELTTGTESPIQLSNGTYKWVAVSYNSKTDQVPDRG